ncbi:MAG: type IV pilus twitching motility protein PilT [Oscillospiraceae bacterium]|nr:type IV pilus twitching motility protein PilT [Oscillospiraceae bacterium]
MLNELIAEARRRGCSDVHLTPGRPCVFRLHGRLIQGEAADAARTRELILSMCTPAQQELLAAGQDLDFSFSTPDGCRQRVNVYHQSGGLAAAVRLLSDAVPTLDALGLPQVLQTFADCPRGLVLVTGPTGSGKSTTLAAMINYINARRPVHILTIEDPIEYIYQDKSALIHQRETGRDVGSFAGALRSALREDPDVILVGEMRDYETISAAVTAAETGHLVLSTLHTTGAAQTVDRIVDVCPAEAQRQMRVQLASVLRGVVTQALVPLASGSGRVAATEILVGTDGVLNLIRDSKSFQLPSMMQAGQAYGMHTLDMDLSSLCRRGLITQDEAYAWAVDKSALTV